MTVIMWVYIDIFFPILKILHETVSTLSTFLEVSSHQILSSIKQHTNSYFCTKLCNVHGEGFK